MADTIHNMRMFMRVAEAGSFTAVANENDLTTAQVSRSVSALEEQLQTVLIHRTTRHLSLTDAGARFFERAKDILAELDYAAAEARNTTVHPEGRIRVHSAPGIAHSTLTSTLVSYQSAYPGVSVELKVAQSMPNLIEDGYDVSLVSTTQLPDSIFVAQMLGRAYTVMLASPGYLARRGVPLTPEQLADHALLRLESPVSPADEWRLQGDAGELVVPVPKSPFQVDSPEVLRSAILAGAGVGTLATYSAVNDLRSGALVRVLPHFHLNEFTVFATYASRRYLDAKVRALLDHLRQTLSPALDEALRVVEDLAATQIAAFTPGNLARGS